MNTSAQIELSDDLFFGGALKIYQPIDGFRSGMDAVFLSASQPDVGSFKVLEAGCGVGVVSLAIAKRCLDAKVDAVEIEPAMVEIANKNIHRNQLDDRVSVYCADIQQPVGKLEALGLKRGDYDFVIANPPFYDEAQALLSDNALRRRANAGDSQLLDDWLRFLTAMAKPDGELLLIHRADKLDEILRVAHGRFGGLYVFPLYPKKGEPAKRVIIRGRKGSKAPMKILQGLVLHDETGALSKAATHISRHLDGLEIC